MIRLIIADDERITRQGLSQLDWARQGFVVAGVAENGLEALEMINSVNPDLLLTDIRMPGLDGLALMEKVGAERPSVKVIFITAYHQLDYALKAIKLGALGFVLKPTDPDEIMEVCLKAKKMIEEERERFRKEEGLRGQLKEYSLTLQGKILADQEESRPHELIREIVSFMESHYMDELTVEHIAKMHHFNPDYLSRLFKKETGDSFLNTLTRIRMQKAIEMLADSRIKVYEISDKVGIRDARYFGQIFKKRFGVTPNDFRKSLFSGNSLTEER